MKKRKILVNSDYELELFGKGYKVLGGIDEAGRGPWAGPVVAAVFVFRENQRLVEGVNDSKLLTPKRREELFEILTQDEDSFAVGEVTHVEIDKQGILRATQLAMLRAFESVAKKPDFVLVDGLFKKKFSFPSEIIINGDRRHYSIAAASVIAKVHRDRLMVELAEKFPQYGFENHKGYGTKQHQEALERFGPCEIHRTSFKPIARLLSE